MARCLPTKAIAAEDGPRAAGGLWKKRLISSQQKDSLRISDQATHRRWIAQITNR
jgi:hypothetical protein